jgi:aminopeptidase N
LGCTVAIFAALTAITSHAEAPFNFETTPGKLPKDVMPLSYNIQLKLNIEKLTFSGSETVILDVRKPVKMITLNVNTARRMFPCWDEPSFRAKFWVRATLPANFTVVSNMIRVGATTKRKIVPGPEGMTLLVLSDRPDSK